MLLHKRSLKILNVNQIPLRKAIPINSDKKIDLLLNFLENQTFIPRLTFLIYTNENYKTQFSNYDGVNTEGERTFTTSTIFGALADLTAMEDLRNLGDISPNYFDPITSPGYKISDLYGTDTYNTKGNFAIHYRPDSVTEISLQSLIGTGKAMLPTGGMMYNIDEVVVQQHKLDYKRGGLKARVYYTHEDAGDTVAGLLMGTAVANSMPSGLVTGYGTPYLQTYLGTLAASKGYPAGLAGVGALLDILLLLLLPPNPIVVTPSLPEPPILLDVGLSKPLLPNKFRF